MLPKRKRENLDKKQQEAFANEYKGNLFEYLIGSLLARYFKIESLFVKSIESTYRQRLMKYEENLRASHPLLPAQLQLLAKKTVESVIEKKELLPARVDAILLTGKIISSQTEAVDDLQEADLVLVSGSSKIPVSIKLTKDGAFVNTKSGGVRTFIEKYFASFSSAAKFQDELNNVLERSFFEMAHLLHEMAGLEFKGSFDVEWREAGLPLLPGQLPEKMSMVVLAYYNKLTEVIYRGVNSFYQEDVEKFLSCLMPIVGLGNKQMLQVKCFYSGELYNYRQTIIHSYDKVFTDNVGGRALRIDSLSTGSGLFEIALHGMRLQIRVKPMNQFVQPSLKVNCSVR